MLPGPALHHARYEVLPTPKVEAAIVESVPRDVQLTVTASPAKGIDATLDLTERLPTQGYHVVPAPGGPDDHRPGELAEIVDRLTASASTTCSAPRATPTRRPVSTSERSACSRT